MVSYDRKAMQKGFLYLYASIPYNIVSIKTIIIMKKLKLFLLSAFLCVGSLAVNSCGDDDEDDAKSSTPSTNDSNVTPNPGGDTNNDKPAPVETKTFTVTFNTDGGSEVAAQTVEDGKTATKPDDPTKDGFDFDGWFNGESLYDFASPVTSNLTLTAQWKQKIIHAPNDYVDLGLPSGTLWATCNVGAQNPWDYGDYFAWGEVTTKEVYNWDTYTAGDAPSVLDAAHDAATVNMGSNWRMPTKAELQELLDNCKWERTSDYNGKGVSGYIVWDMYFHKTHIFLPAAGFRVNSGLRDAGSGGYYWSSSVYDSRYAWELDFYSGDRYVRNYDRPHGQTVRAVRCRN